MVDIPECVVCRAADEDCIHAIRDCNEAMEVWLHTVPHPFMKIFLSLGLGE